MNVFASQLSKPDDYDGIDGKPVPATRGENLPFVNLDGQPCHTGKASRDEKGKRKIVLTINSWVGTTAMNAVHYYARLEAWGVSYHSLDSAPDDRLNVSGHGDIAKPKEQKRIEIRVDRPATQRDIDHWLAIHGEDNETREWSCPKLGGIETGFWERGEAIVAGKAVYDRWFGDENGWALYVDDPDLESDTTEVPWDDSILQTIPAAIAKTRHDVDWKTKWVDPYAEDVTELTPPTDALGPDLDFTKQKVQRCRHCRKDKGNHKNGNLACPIGTKHRSVGYTQFSATQVFSA